jgi:hypothetical protein
MAQLFLADITDYNSLQTATDLKNATKHHDQKTGLTGQ